MAGLAEEQAALRRVATVVARQGSPGEVLAATAEEFARVFGLRDVRMVRAETASGSVIGAATSDGVRTVTAPIVVAGRPWGAIVASSPDPLPSDIEIGLSQFTELMGTAIANTEARTELTRLVDEQAALRRVAFKVAEGCSTEQLLATIAEEVTHLTGFDVGSGIYRFESDDTATLVAVYGRQTRDGVHLGQRLPIDGTGIAATVRRSRRSARVDDYSATTGRIAERARLHGVGAALGCPIVVRGRLWGALVVTRFDAEQFSIDIEHHIAEFTDLVAIAIANAESHAEVQRLAEEQAALRRVATLVAQGAAPDEVFDAVITEVGRLLGAAQIGLARYESEREISVLAMQGADRSLLRAGMHIPLDGDSVSVRVLRTGRSARLDTYPERSSIGNVLHQQDVSVSLGVPIVVDGALWGMIGASWKGDERPPDDAEERLVEFGQLVDTAIANADSRDKLTASRKRVISAEDEARRRIVRDLHDGAQQRLIHTTITLKLAHRALRENPDRAEALLAEALEQAAQGNAELRELSHGILPSVLTRGGLRAGVDTVVSRMDLPVDVNVLDTRQAPEIEASAYFVVAEALTNAVKHSHATRVKVTARPENEGLRVEIRDDGVGGADSNGRGLIGIADRVAAFGGSLQIYSPAGGGTVLTVHFPDSRH